jgi:hypothetical protein
MIEAIAMIAAGFAILYWAFWVSHKGAESSRVPPNPKDADKA